MFRAAVVLGLCCLLVRAAPGDRTTFLESNSKVTDRRNDVAVFVARQGRQARSTETVFPDCVHREKECPKYRVLKNITGNIEQRHLSGNLYALINTNTCNMSAAYGVGYMPLHQYFRGANTRNENIQRLPPVVLVHKSTENPPEGCSFTYNLMFHMPAKLHFNASKPTGSGVQLYWMEAMNAFALTFNDNMTSDVWEQKAAEFQSFLDDRHYCYNDNFTAFATYDAPHRPRPHRHEIWLLQVDCQNSSTSCKHTTVETLKLTSLALLVLVLASDAWS